MSDVSVLAGFCVAPRVSECALLLVINAHVHWMDGTKPSINTFAAPVLAVLDARKLLKVLRRSLSHCSKFQLNGDFSLKSCIYQPHDVGLTKSDSFVESFVGLTNSDSFVEALPFIRRSFAIHSSKLCQYGQGPTETDFRICICNESFPVPSHSITPTKHQGTPVFPSHSITLHTSGPF